jgi:hypothetical protein
VSSSCENRTCRISLIVTLPLLCFSTRTSRRQRDELEDTGIKAGARDGNLLSSYHYPKGLLAINATATHHFLDNPTSDLR